MSASLVGSEMCIRDSYPTALVYVSDAHGRMSVLCSQDAFDRLWEVWVCLEFYPLSDRIVDPALWG
eukprot:3219557-Alexandrium_andersonii.AAC.1